MRIAIVGSGISGLAAAWLLSRAHDVVLFEAEDRLGGHTHTHEIAIDGERHAVDTGFIVHNRAHYPLLTRLFETLGVRTQPTTMSFSVQCERTGFEYSSEPGGLLGGRNLASPRFYALMRDIARFYRIAPSLLDDSGDGPTLAEFLSRHRFGDAFRDLHLIPMASALWSSPSNRILEFPARCLAEFLQNHDMLTFGRRPSWRVVAGGSRRYIDVMRKSWRVDVRIGTPVRSIRRDRDVVEISHSGRVERFDHAILATHSDDALALLDDASDTERDVLGAMPYQSNDVVLHTDETLLPRRRSAWAAWNAFVPRDPAHAATVSYCMNRLQRLDAASTYVVTLNRTEAIDPAKVLRRMTYRHPLHSHASFAAQARKAEIQGHRRTWFAGAYWGWGFHEDGMRSACDVAGALGVRWSAASPAAQATSVPLTPGFAVP
jgi:predicted NAD/FAD-binding protein